jgi:hypothetical protein
MFLFIYVYKVFIVIGLSQNMFVNVGIIILLICIDILCLDSLFCPLALIFVCVRKVNFVKFANLLLILCTIQSSLNIDESLDIKQNNTQLEYILT